MAANTIFSPPLNSISLSFPSVAHNPQKQQPHTHSYPPTISQTYSKQPPLHDFPSTYVPPKTPANQSPSLPSLHHYPYPLYSSSSIQDNM